MDVPKITLPHGWHLAVLDDPMAGGVTWRAELGSGTDDELWLSLVAIPGKLVDASLYRKRTLPEPIKLHDGTVARVADLFVSKITGATDMATAIRAVEEAAIIAGWATR